jgi:hypothetical protein
VHVFEKIEKLEDAFALAQAADEYLIHALKAPSSKAIQKMLSVDNIWDSINQLQRFPELAKATCEEVMNYNFP